MLGMTAAFVLSLPSVLPQLSWLDEAVQGIQNPVALMGGLSMGLSLYLIHVYVTPLKRFVQILWAIGVLSGVAIMVTKAEPVVSYTAHHPQSILGVGFMFAAITGVAVKEGLCYGKLEAAALALLTPILCLTHLFSSGLSPGETPPLLPLWMLALIVFAARKYTQPVKDDIGDKSVFMFQAVPDEEKESWLRQRAEQGLYTPAPPLQGGGQ